MRHTLGTSSFSCELHRDQRRQHELFVAHSIATLGSITSRTSSAVGCCLSREGSDDTNGQAKSPISANKLQGMYAQSREESATAHHTRDPILISSSLTKVAKRPIRVAYSYKPEQSSCQAKAQEKCKKNRSHAPKRKNANLHERDPRLRSEYQSRL